MRKIYNMEELAKLWNELMMKFPANIYQVTVQPHAESIIFKLREITRPIRDAMILRRFQSQSGVEVGFFKPRRISPGHRRLPKKEQPVYKVWLTVHVHPLALLDIGNRNRNAPHRDLNPQEFEKCLDLIVEKPEHISFSTSSSF
jgi:hypothetical protein